MWPFKNFFFNLLKTYSSRAFVCCLAHLTTATRFWVRQGGGTKSSAPPPPAGRVRPNTPAGRRFNVVRHMFYGSFGTHNSMVTFIFKFDHREGQLQVKLGQISEFKVFFYKKCAYLVQFCLRIPKYYLLLCQPIRNTKNCISKTWRRHLYLFFFGHCTAKNKDIALKFCMRVVCMYHDHIYSDFLDKLKSLDFTGNLFLRNWNNEFWGQNLKISEIRDSHIVERSILRRLAFLNCVLLPNWTF